MSKLKIKQGFTLIELLAVIVILAVIALIAVPVVMNIIDKANKSAFKDSAYGILKAGDLYYAEQQMSLNGMKEDEVFEFPNNIGALQLNGNLPQGTMVLTKTGNIALAITNGKYCITKDYDDEDIKLLENTSRCAIPYTLAAVATTSEELGVTKVDECIKRGTLCNFGPGVEEPTSFAIEVNGTDIYKFYVINDDGKEVTLIMNRNLYSAEDLANNNYNVSWISADDYKDNDSCAYPCNDQGPLTALAVLKERTNEWVNILERNFIISDDGENRYGDFSIIMRARLPKFSELYPLQVVNGNKLPSYLLKNSDNNDSGKGYWTSTSSSISSRSGWSVQYDDGILYNDAWIDIAHLRGIRPVITLSK